LALLFIYPPNGHVLIDSRLGAGTSVRLYLPRHHGEVAAEIRRTLAGEGPLPDAIDAA